MILDRFALKALHCMDAETAHGMSIKALQAGLGPQFDASYDKRLAIDICGFHFPNPLGIAAGYDKNCEVPDALLRMGFGFVEAGTITPLPQTGNTKPRLFRLPDDYGVINRMGFNNDGHAACLERLKARKGKKGIIGINIGANKDSQDRVEDYVKGAERFAPYADYLTVNVSSPNTPGLRNLQSRESLAELLNRVLTARDETCKNQAKKTPVFLKVAPDLSEQELDDIAEEVLASSTDGLIVSNTTLSRNGLKQTVHAKEAGGLSGRPVFRRSTIVLAKLRQRVGPDFPVIGVGGIEDTETAMEKICAGADLVQLYSCMIYGGPRLPAQILKGMSKTLDRDGIRTLSDIRSSRMDHWASLSL